MNKDSNKSKVRTYIENLTSEEASLKRIPFYLFLIGVLIVVFIIQISETNKYLKIIAESENPSIEIHTRDENYDKVLDIYSESPKSPEEILSNPYNDIEGQSTPQENDEGVEPSSSTSNKQSYVINTGTKKIHKPDCSFVKRTNDENKKSVELSKDELKEYTNNGYEICKTCGGK